MSQASKVAKTSANIFNRISNGICVNADAERAIDDDGYEVTGVKCDSEDFEF